MISDADNVNPENPFEASRVLGDKGFVEKANESPYDFDLDGNLIVCGSHLILPPICVYTGVTEDLAEIQSTTVFPSMRLVVVQRFCSVVMYIARSEQTRRKKIAWIQGAFVAAGIALMMMTMFLNGIQREILFFAGLVIVGMSMFLLNRQNLPLTLVRYRAPGIYWVKGFPKTFLAQLATIKLNNIGKTSHTSEAETNSEFEI